MGEDVGADRASASERDDPELRRVAAIWRPYRWMPACSRAPSCQLGACAAAAPRRLVRPPTVWRQVRRVLRAHGTSGRNGGCSPGPASRPRAEDRLATSARTSSPTPATPAGARRARRRSRRGSGPPGRCRRSSAMRSPGRPCRAAARGRPAGRSVSGASSTAVFERRQRVRAQAVGDRRDLAEQRDQVAARARPASAPRARVELIDQRGQLAGRDQRARPGAAAGAARSQRRRAPRAARAAPRATSARVPGTRR